MSYRAYGYGVFTLIGDSTIEDINAAVAEILIDDEQLSVSSVDDKTVAFKYNPFYEYNYHEEDVIDILDAIKKFIAEGSRVEFTGDDGESWAFTLLNGEWVDESGCVVYGIYPCADIRINGGRLIADKEMTRFLLDVLAFAGQKYEQDIEWVDDDRKEEYASKAKLCNELWWKIDGDYVKACK